MCASSPSCYRWTRITPWILLPRLAKKWNLLPTTTTVRWWATYHAHKRTWLSARSHTGVMIKRLRQLLLTFLLEVFHNFYAVVGRRRRRCMETFYLKSNTFREMVTVDAGRFTIQIWNEKIESNKPSMKSTGQTSRLPDTVDSTPSVSRWKGIQECNINGKTLSTITTPTWTQHYNTERGRTPGEQDKNRK